MDIRPPKPKRMPYREIEEADLYPPPTPPKPPRGPKPVCGAKTRRGTPCQCKQFKSGRCKFHGGLSTGPRTPEGRAAISRAMKARWAAKRVRT